MLPYSGQISYNQIRGEFGNPSNFDLQNAYNGGFGSLNPFSFIQPADSGGANYSPDLWYGYDGSWIVTSGLIINYDAFPNVNSYPGFGTTVTNVGDNFPFNNGTLINGTGWIPSDGGIWVLDGQDDYIGSSSGPNPLTEITCEIWIRAQGSWSIGSGAGQATFNVDDFPTSNMWGIFPNGTVPSVSWGFFANANPPGSFNIMSVNTSISLTAGDWWQVVGTYSSTATKIYVNGALSGTAAGGAGIISNPSNTLVLGGDPRYDFRRLTGNIAAFHMYNRELNSSEVLQNFNAIRGRFGI